MNPQAAGITVRKTRVKTSATDLSLLVNGATAEEYHPWDRDKIADALSREAGVPHETAFDIARVVEERIIKSGMARVDTTLVRSLVNNELFERGLTTQLRQQTVIGIPKYDLDNIIRTPNKENSNIVANSPEAVAQTVNEIIFKQYALECVFPRHIADAHREGRIYLHDLGYPIRVYCSGHSLEWLKMFGLRLDNLATASSPAKHARVLTGHLNTFLASMQAYYAGALGLAYLNIFYAPYLVGLSDKEVKQEAQYLIYSCSQNAFSRGGQTLFLDFNIHLGVPSYLRNIPAIGPGGKPTGKTYGEYEREVQRFAKALLDVYREGDADGNIFPFPKCDIHIDKMTFKRARQRKLLEYACQVASENGSPYFVFDRNAMTVAACCRLKTIITDIEMIKHPERLRFCGFQNVTINLPQAAYRAGGDVGALYHHIDTAMSLAFEAHSVKRDFVQSLMGAGLPLWQVGRETPDGSPYIDLKKATYIVGLLGLNECVKHCTGKELHESNEALMLGLDIVSHMQDRCVKETAATGYGFSLEESPAESATRRLAKLDVARYQEAKSVVRGSLENDDIYYTNSVHVRADADVDLVTRIKLQAKFHGMIDAGAITHAFVGEKLPDAQSLYRLVDLTLAKTNTAQLTISPEFTICHSCHRKSVGVHEKCLFCGCTEVDGMSRIVGYFSRTSKWNQSKIGELHARRRGQYHVGVHA